MAKSDNDYNPDRFQPWYMDRMIQARIFAGVIACIFIVLGLVMMLIPQRVAVAEGYIVSIEENQIRVFAGNITSSRSGLLSDNPVIVTQNICWKPPNYPECKVGARVGLVYLHNAFVEWWFIESVKL